MFYITKVRLDTIVLYGALPGEGWDWGDWGGTVGVKFYLKN